MKYKKIHSCYVTVKKGKSEVVTTKEVIKGSVFADFDLNGKVIGFEFIVPFSVELDREVK
jgi:uncharacterized protein YuzE